jgi:hypothetical protein
MKKQSIIAFLLVAIIVMATALVLASTRTSPDLAEQEECTQQESNDCGAKNSEFLLESLTRNLLSR